MWLLYQIATILALVVAGPFLLIRRGRHYLTTLPGRLGRYPAPIEPHPLWIHAVSVGEVGVAHTLVRGLPADLPLLITTVTPTGQARARSLFENRATVAYLPYDLGPLVRRFLDRFEPRALIMVEGDLWPLLLSQVRSRGIPSAVVNGRVSDQSCRRLKRIPALVRPIFGPVDRFGMQSEEDRQRLLRLGVPADSVAVTGNLKFETRRQEVDPALAASLRAQAQSRAILVVGSTMAGEESLVLEAFGQIGADRALLILAPRHPERWNDVEDQIRSRGFSVLRRTALGESHGRTEVLLLDTLGELAGIYEIGLGCFIGGTLVPTGGHNPLEAAAHGVAVSAGPSMENFREIAQAFDDKQAWERIKDATQLARVWNRWIADPATAESTGQRGLAVVTENQGSLEATRSFLEPMLGGRASTATELPA